MPLRHMLFPSPFGLIAVVWEEGDTPPKVRQMFLSSRSVPAEERLVRSIPQSRSGRCSPILELAHRMQSFLEGEDVRFTLDDLALDHCSEFQRKVLLAEYSIPRGSVSTYGRIASHIGVPGAARAVGTALARNPFPVIIPCHRAIRSDGHLGGYQGGTSMKRALLEYEGVRFSKSGKVIRPRWWF